jgi:hypothetical protein
MKYLLVFSLAFGLVACEDSAQEKLAKIELEKKPLVDAISKKNACVRAARLKKDIDSERKCVAELEKWRKENNK